MAKKYIRVKSHWRAIGWTEVDGGTVGGRSIPVHAHIRKNPKYKEIKMNKDEKTEGTTEVVDHGLAQKELRPRYVNVSIKLADAHYLTSFNHGPTRIFHNIDEVLMAIEAEINRLHG